MMQSWAGEPTGALLRSAGRFDAPPRLQSSGCLLSPPEHWPRRGLRPALCTRAGAAHPLGFPGRRAYLSSVPATMAGRCGSSARPSSILGDAMAAGAKPSLAERSRARRPFRGCSFGPTASSTAASTTFSGGPRVHPRGTSRPSLGISPALASPPWSRSTTRTSLAVETSRARHSQSHSPSTDRRPVHSLTEA